MLTSQSDLFTYARMRTGAARPLSTPNTVLWSFASLVHPWVQMNIWAKFEENLSMRFWDLAFIRVGHHEVTVTSTLNTKIWTVHLWVQVDICAKFQEIPSRCSWYIKLTNNPKTYASGHIYRWRRGITRAETITWVTQIIRLQKMVEAKSLPQGFVRFLSPALCGLLSSGVIFPHGMLLQKDTTTLRIDSTWWRRAKKLSMKDRECPKFGIISHLKKKVTQCNVSTAKQVWRTTTARQQRFNIWTESIQLLTPAHQASPTQRNINIDVS